ncbi:hypothetical protein [Pseudomonas pergaminensis]
METTFEGASLHTVIALVLWAGVTLWICSRVRSGKVIGGGTAAKQNIWLGLLLVLVSVCASTYSWSQVNEFKTYMLAETEALQDDIDRRNADTHQKNCDKQPEKPCAPAKPTPRLSVYSEPLNQSLDKVVEIIGVVLGLLGGALGVNLITDGLLKKEPSRYSPVTRRGTQVTRTLGFKGWKLEQVTAWSCPPSSDEKNTSPPA